MASALLLPRRHDHHSERSWERRLLAGLDAADTHDKQLTRT
jgi:hypothetical protein